MKLRTALVFAVIAAIAACDKSTSSGALPAGDAELFKLLPPGTVMFGGNYAKLQSFMQSSLGKRAAGSVRGIKEWTECLVATNGRVAGVAIVAGAKREMRMVFAGIEVKDFAKCADKAGIKSTIDPDGKYIAVEVPTLGTATATLGYLAVGSDRMYMRQDSASGRNAKRADLEADLAALAKTGTAADDPKLQPLVAKVDRSRTLWFVANAAGTPFGEAIGEAYGAVDITPGVAIDATVQVARDELVKKVEDGYAQIRKARDKLPADMKDVLDAVVLDRSGDRFHVVAKLTDAQLDTVLRMARMFSGI